MTGISHFQTYSQRENHVTNNTLLMLRHVYRASPLRLGEVLRALLGEEITVGPDFAQQARSAHSIPDALIEQPAFHLYIEAKHGGTLYDDQLKNHLRSIADKGHAPATAYLIGLTRAAPAETELAETRNHAEEVRIRFGVATYAELLSTLDQACQGDPALCEILSDYRGFIAGEELLPDQHRKMVAFLCGTTLRENIAYDAYYEPETRNPKWTQAHLVGLYNNKRVSHIGRIAAVAVCRRQGSGPLEVLAEEFGALTDEHRTRIIGVIDGAADYYPGFAEDPHRFYLVERFCETDLRKTSPGGMMGHRYFDLSHDFGLDLSQKTDIEEIAHRLSGKTYA